MVNERKDKIKKQILAVRDTGLTNMFNVRAVQRIAFDMNFFELVCFLEENRDDYVRFILYGESELKELNYD